MKKIIVAIDGHSACGKSTTAKLVATMLRYAYIDTGAMYRATALYFKQNHVNLTDPKAVAHALLEIEIGFRPNPKNGENETYLNGLNVEQEIRKMYVSEMVSEVAAIVEVRHAMVAQQQKMGKKKGIVMDGRDIGTTVFPQAELKIFMTAGFQIRADRRQGELLENGELIPIEEVIMNLRKRDEIDSNRKESPLRQAEDAYVVDTSHITIEEQVEQIVNLCAGKMIAA